VQAPVEVGAYIDFEKCGTSDIKGLIKALGYIKDEDVRTAAAGALGQIGDPRAVEPLIAALKDEGESVRSSAARALGKIGDPRAVESLIAALKDKKWHVRKPAAGALDRLAWKPDRGAAGAAYWAAKGEWGKCVEIGAPAVEPLIAALKDEDVRMRAVEALGKIGDPRAVEPLIAALKDQDERMRKWAAEALGQIGDPRAVEPLIAALKDQDVRMRAVEALGKIGDPRAVEPLIAALNDRDERVRKWAAEALGKIGDPRAVEPLIAALRDQNRDVRRASVWALGEIGDPAPSSPSSPPSRTTASAYARLPPRRWTHSRGVRTGVRSEPPTGRRKASGTNAPRSAPPPSRCSSPPLPSRTTTSAYARLPPRRSARSVLPPSNS